MSSKLEAVLIVLETLGAVIAVAVPAARRIASALDVSTQE